MLLRGEPEQVHV